MPDVIYNDDHRYPGPDVYALPDFISGTPTQDELDAQVRLFTWGELKEIIKSGELEYLSRNKEMQARYGEWIGHQKEIWGSSESYLVNARLPWTTNSKRPCEPTYDQRTVYDHPGVDLTPSTNPASKNAKNVRSKSPTNAKRTPVSPELLPVGAGRAAVAAHALNPPTSGQQSQFHASHAATAGNSPTGSGASTPSSVAYVSLESVLPRVNKALARRKARAMRSNVVSATNTPSESDAEDEVDDDDPAKDVFLRWEGHLDPDKYAVLPNDWPYCVPYGVRHYCVWSRVPIAHPVTVNYDRRAWAHVESKGLGGFTGVVPLLRDSDPDSASDGSDENENSLPAEAALTPPHSPTASQMPQTPPPKDPSAEGRAGPDCAGKGGWYAVDVEYGGREMRRWAGVTYESKGGEEVGRMVRGLWDERGWETLWFVNPAHLQSVPGFSHFHVFARRKTPAEIDISEKVHDARAARAVAKAERSKNKNRTEVAEGLVAPEVAEEGETPRADAADAADGKQLGNGNVQVNGTVAPVAA